MTRRGNPDGDIGIVKAIILGTIFGSAAAYGAWWLFTLLGFKPGHH